jgi:hypothetical protein
MKPPKRQEDHLAPLSSYLHNPSLYPVGETAALPRLTWLEFFMERDFEKKKPSQAKLCKLIWVYITKCVSQPVVCKGVRRKIETLNVI